MENEVIKITKEDIVENQEKEQPYIEFIPLALVEEEEKQYLRVKAFLSENENDLEINIKKINRAINDAEKNRGTFIMVLASSKDQLPDEDFSNLERIIANYDTTISQFKTSLEKHERALKNVQKILRECYTEKIRDGIAYVNQKGKTFTKYFSLILDNNE